MNLTKFKKVDIFPKMGVQFGTTGNLCAQIRAGALSSVEVLSKLFSRIETFDSINVVAESDFKERHVRLWCSR
jgi:Asp-tRNA(Asn)/Glu-tRNA(Gln) amidotransferase A subunit family amidase